MEYRNASNLSRGTGRRAAFCSVCRGSERQSAEQGMAANSSGLVDESDDHKPRGVEVELNSQLWNGGLSATSRGNF